jgi:hypothetical protein
MSSDPEVERLKRDVAILNETIDDIFRLLKGMGTDLDDLGRLRRKGAKEVEVSIVDRRPQ